jgi:hypothetical protein
MLGHLSQLFLHLTIDQYFDEHARAIGLADDHAWPSDGRLLIGRDGAALLRRLSPFATSYYSSERGWLWSNPGHGQSPEQIEVISV